MPTLAAPAYLVATALAALVVVGLHLLAWRRPRPVPLPTARFVPAQPVRAASRELQLQDVALLALRVLALLAAGLALSGPTIAPPRRGTARVVVVDASRRVARMDEVRDSLRRALDGADQAVVIRVDSVARLVADSAIGDRANVPSLLSAGVVAAVREARRRSATAQRVDVVVISPFAREGWDSAAVLARGAWDGAVQVMRVAATAPPANRDGGATRPGDQLPPAADPVGAAFALRADAGHAPLRVRRDSPTAADSAWAREGGVLVWWPRDGASRRDSSGTARPAVLAWGRDAAIAAFAPLDIALPAALPIVRWGDGSPAATESTLGRGCLRTVAASMPASGDAPLRPAVLRLAAFLGAPCGGAGAPLVDDATLAAWGRGGATSAARPAAQHAPPSPTVARLFLLLAAALLAAEWWWRRRAGAGASGIARRDATSPGAREAA